MIRILGELELLCGCREFVVGASAVSGIGVIRVLGLGFGAEGLWLHLFR